jgi:hypothetical protein
LLSICDKVILPLCRGPVNKTIFFFRSSKFYSALKTTSYGPGFFTLS